MQLLGPNQWRTKTPWAGEKKTTPYPSCPNQVRVRRGTIKHIREKTRKGASYAHDSQGEGRFRGLSRGKQCVRHALKGLITAE